MRRFVTRLVFLAAVFVLSPFGQMVAEATRGRTGGH